MMEPGKLLGTKRLTYLGQDLLTIPECSNADKRSMSVDRTVGRDS